MALSSLFRNVLVAYACGASGIYVSAPQLDSEQGPLPRDTNPA